MSPPRKRGSSACRGRWQWKVWIPAFAGMTRRVGACRAQLARVRQPEAPQDEARASPNAIASGAENGEHLSGLMARPRRQRVTARAHVGGHGRVWRRHHAKSEAQSDSRFDRLIREAAGAGASRLIPRHGAPCAVAAVRHSAQRRGLVEMAGTPQLESGNVGEDTVRCKPLAPRGTGSDGSRLHQRGNIPPSANAAPRCARVFLSALLAGPRRARRRCHGSSASPTHGLRQSDVHSSRLRSRAPSMMRTICTPSVVRRYSANQRWTINDLAPSAISGRAGPSSG